MHEVLVNRLGGLSLPRKSVVSLTDRPDLTLDVYRGRKTTTQQRHYKWYRKQEQFRTWNGMEQNSFTLLYATGMTLQQERIPPLARTEQSLPWRQKYHLVNQCDNDPPIHSPPVHPTPAFKLFPVNLLLLLCCFTSMVNI